MSDFRAILGADLTEDENGDLVIDAGRGDFAGVEGIDCFLADLRTILNTPPAGLIDAPYEGGLFSREAPMDELAVMEQRRRYEELLASEPRIKQASIKIEASLRDGIPVFSASFETITDQVVENFVL